MTLAEQFKGDIEKQTTLEGKLRESLRIAIWMIGLVYDTDDVMADARIQTLTAGLRQQLNGVLDEAVRKQVVEINARLHRMR